MEALCKVYLLIDENKLEASGTADFIRECMATFVGASVKAGSVTVNVVNFPDTSDADKENVDATSQGAAPASAHEDKIGDTINFYSNQDYNADDFINPYTATFRTVGHGEFETDVWSVKITKAGSHSAHPVSDKCTTDTSFKNFDTRDEVIAYMAEFGFKPV